MSHVPSSPIIVALDYPSGNEARALLDNLDPKLCRVKIGKELFSRTGPSFVSDVVKQGFDVFLDLKFHDIPNTVAGAIQSCSQLGVWMLNVHASGGEKMMSAAREALACEFSNEQERPLLIAVTVLTSLSAADLNEIGFSAEPKQLALSLARLTERAGLDGVVCSAAEASALRAQSADAFVLVTPGIRRPTDTTGDQERIVGPAEAIAAGSNFLVVGRPITRAEEPLVALREFNQLLT